MTPAAVAAVLDRRFGAVARATARVGREVDVAALGVSDRADHLDLAEPGRVSANGACRLIRAADGWVAVNLAREEDRDLVPAWVGGDFGEDPWALAERLAPARPAARLLADGILLGLPVSTPGEATATGPGPVVHPGGAPASRSGAAPLRVVDLSAMWAGPMCGAILAAMGADVLRIESAARPDPTRTHTPAFFRNLNGAKAERVVDLSDPEQTAWLRGQALAADIVVSGARLRGLAALGVTPAEYLRVRPGGVWIAVTGHGWGGAAGERVAFGDDAAAAGGLLAWTAQGEPRFLGDALADPFTGLAAAVAGLEALMAGGGRLVDAALARCAAAAASEAGLRP